MPTVTKRAEIDSVGYDVGEDLAQYGNLSIRWAKLTHVDGVLVSRENHRAFLETGADPAAMIAAVNRDLESMGFGTMPAVDTTLVNAATSILWTPDVLKAASDKEAARQAAEAADAEQMAKAIQEQEDAKAAAFDEAVAAAVARNSEKA